MTTLKDLMSSATVCVTLRCHFMYSAIICITLRCHFISSAIICVTLRDVTLYLVQLFVSL